MNDNTYYVTDDSGTPTREYYATPLEAFAPGAHYKTVERDGDEGETSVPDNYDGPHTTWDEYFS